MFRRARLAPLFVAMLAACSAIDSSPATGDSPNASQGGHAGRSAPIDAVGGETSLSGNGGGGGEQLAGAAGGGGGGTTSFNGLGKSGLASGRRIGVAVNHSLLTSNAEYRATVEAEFSQITPENEMKWESLAPTRDSFKWTQADVLVSFAEENGMTVHGHTLVWHSQLPSWVTTLSTDEVEGAMNEHIDAVVSRYRGRIRSWDVVNEALADTGALRVSPFSAALGEEFIDKAFAAARSADPDAILFYNDYGIEHLGPKSDALFALVKRLLERGVPIQGVGFQMHIASTGNPSASSFRDNLARFAALGLHTSITEMDVRIGKSTADTKTALSNQAERYYEIIRVCRLQPKCGTITFWGVDDGHSWLDLPSMEGVFGKGPHQGLLFDTHFDPKPAYDRARDALD